MDNLSHIKVYIDEDAMDGDFVAALRSRGVIVITALDAHLSGSLMRNNWPSPLNMGVSSTASMSRISIDFTPSGSVQGGNTPE